MFSEKLHIDTPCKCGCKYIVFFVEEEGRYSTRAEIPVTLHRTETQDVRCYRCNRDRGQNGGATL